MGTTPSDSGAPAKAGWSLVILSCGLALFPVVGVVAYIVAWPMLLAAFVLSIVALSRAFRFSRLLLLLSSAVFAPIFVLTVPVIVNTLGIGFVATLEPTVKARPAKRAEPSTGIATPPPKPTPRPVPTGTAATAAQARAIAKFPELRVGNSPLNKAFVELLRRYQTEKPEVFDDPDWPTIIATDASASRK